jgi:hypothetical protein
LSGKIGSKIENVTPVTFLAPPWLVGSILFHNNSTRDTWFEAISNGAFNGWNQIGGSTTGYTVKT